MISFGISDKATPDVKVLGERVFSDASRSAVGAAVTARVQEHFIGLPTNKRGWPSTGFWAGAARSTHYTLIPGGVKVGVAQQGVRQRFFGGRISAVNAKYLTIPARAEAYGNRAREFNNLRFIKFKSGAAALVEANRTDIKFGRKKKDGQRAVKKQELGGLVMFWLVPSVVQEANPNILPSMADLGETAATATRDFIAGVLWSGPQEGTP